MPSSWPNISPVLTGLALIGLVAARPPVVPPPRPYADLADLTTAAPIIAEVRIRKAQPVNGAGAQGVPPSAQRYLITADVAALLRAPGTLPPQITYLYDAPRDGRGKLPKLTKAAMLIFAQPVSNRPNAVQLIAPDAQIAAFAGDVSRVRTIVADASAPDSPPRITGVGSAFHVAGTLSGEGETQIFLNSNDGRPMSLTVVRTRGATPQWSVSIGEIVDASMTTPPRDSFLWYRLACFLPRALPARSTVDVSAAEAAIVGEDYATVIRDLGQCPRDRPRG